MANSDWNGHDGGPCPVAGGAKVQVRFRDGELASVHPAKFWNHAPGLSNWNHDQERYDITSYRIVSPLGEESGS